MILTGKPSRHAMRFVAQRLGVPVSRVGVVGDDPVVEMSMARRVGAAAFGVTTGVTSAEDWRRQPLSRRPHRVLTRPARSAEAAAVDQLEIVDAVADISRGS